METDKHVNFDTAIVDRLLDPFARKLTPSAARALVNFRVDAQTQARVCELAEKCNEGTLSTGERAEYEAIVRAGDFISILQSKARRLLKSRKS